MPYFRDLVRLLDLRLLRCIFGFAAHKCRQYEHINGCYQLTDAWTLGNEGLLDCDGLDFGNGLEEEVVVKLMYP